MHDDRIQNIEEALARIETALIGDSEMGNPGLVHRVGTVESKVKHIEGDRLKLIGVVTGVGGVVSLLITYVFGK